MSGNYPERWFTDIFRRVNISRFDPWLIEWFLKIPHPSRWPMTIWPQFNSIRQKWKQSVKSEQLDKSEQCSKSMQLSSHEISLFAVQYWISKNFIIHRETRRLKRWPSYSKDSVWLRLRFECIASIHPMKKQQPFIPIFCFPLSAL